jgi:chemosensory pili system protein ChpA (sensor histidine kinase/response regulator)
MAEEAICLFVRTDKHHQICFLADVLLGQVNLPIESLPHPLVPPKGFLGVSLQTNGQLVSVLDPIALAATIAEGNGIAFANDDEEIPTVASELVLIVDDAALMRRRFEASLNGYGFATVTCNDGLAAWQWIQANGVPSLLITDVEMPIMDGFTLISRCRQAGYQMPILVVSSRVTTEWVNEARRLGADNYLNKGFSTAELMQKVNSFFDKTVAR